MPDSALATTPPTTDAERAASARREEERRRLDAEALQRTVRVEPWPDSVLDQVGHDPRSTYVERFWLPVLGPSTTLLLRRLADGLDESPEGFELHLADAARQLGLGIRGTRQSPFLRALDRCCSFGAAQQLPGDRLAVRRRLAPLSQRQQQRLTPALAAEHERWAARSSTHQAARGAGAMGAEEQRRRARALALSLLQLGESEADTERQLHRWHFHPAMAHEALRWAIADVAGDEQP